MERRPNVDPGLTLRRAVATDAPTLADLYLLARRAAEPTIPPIAHTNANVHVWFREVVLPAYQTWIAEADGHVAAVLVLNGDDLDQLYVHTDRTGGGISSRLVQHAKDLRPSGLSLWTFQSNRGAQRFYERHGFVAVERTDGSTNEERSPDVRYVWSHIRRQ
ncbi:MAG: GNAT family N-acetyltransferase [Ornithinimicrobium sp.]